MGVNVCEYRWGCRDVNEDCMCVQVLDLLSLDSYGTMLGIDDGNSCCAGTTCNCGHCVLNMADELFVKGR